MSFTRNRGGYRRRNRYAADTTRRRRPRWGGQSKWTRRHRDSNTRRTGGSGGPETLARIGFIARGIAYIVIGILGFMLAFGIARHAPERAGALQAIATEPLGYLLLWILVIGFAGLAVWRLTQATARLPGRTDIASTPWPPESVMPSSLSALSCSWCTGAHPNPATPPPAI